MAMAHRRALPIVATLRSHDLVDLGLHELVQHSQPDTNAERQQPFPGGAGELAERLTHPLRPLLNAGVLRRDRRDRYGPHSGWSSVLAVTWFAPVTVPSGPDEAGGPPSS